MQVAKYQNTITLFLAQCPVKSSPSATLVHAQSWRAGLYRAYIPPHVGLMSPAAANSQGKLNDKDGVT